MEEKKPEGTDNVIFHWVENLVGTGSRFSLNLFISLFGGIMYTLDVWSSPFVLVIFGVVSPLLFTLCLYFLIRYLSDSEENPFPKLFASRSSNTIIMLFDMALIIGLAVLIHSEILDFFFFRLLQTVILPIILIFMLRLIYVNITQNENMD